MCSGYNSQAYKSSSFSKGAPPADVFTPEVEDTPEVEETSVVEQVGYSLPPPDPVYQAGELSQYKNSYEYGDYQRETEEEGSFPPPPPPPPLAPAKPKAQFTSPPRPLPGHLRFRGYLPYFDYNFLYGNYPRGTYTHSSSSYEQGRDHWRDAHYVKYIPFEPVATEEPEPLKYPVDVDQYPAPAVAPYDQPAPVKYQSQVRSN